MKTKITCVLLVIGMAVYFVVGTAIYKQERDVAMFWLRAYSKAYDNCQETLRKGFGNETF